MTALWAQQDALISQVNADGDVSDAEQEQLDALEAKIERVKNAISQYEETLDEKQSIDEEYLDNQIEIWDTNFDILTESLEHNLSFNEADLELIDYYLSKMEDNMFKLAEAYTKLNEKSIEYSDNLDI
jgi:chromosome segregation ATPase